MTYEYVVERDVDYTGHDHEIHRTFRVTKASEYGCDDVVGDDERDADEAYSQIIDCAFDRLLRCVY